MTLTTDRWLEMDLTWFDPSQSLRPQIDILLTRIAPLLKSVGGQRGIFFNVGWLIDLITEWSGRPEQQIPTRSRRTAPWAAKTYADLRDFIGHIRAQAGEHGLPDLKIGVLVVGWGHVVWPSTLKIYDFDSDWHNRHPELYSAPLNFIGMPVLLSVNRLHSDHYTYATYPKGLPEETYFPNFFGAQWGHVSRFLGLDALLLRDGLTGPLVYTRVGPYGLRAPDDPETVAAFSQSVRDLYRAVKTANPAALLLGYSSAISPVADWRVGCVDFEALVADGYIDAWIEQTWGGAWQDWWHQLWKGWTFQLANLLTRGAMIARANEQRQTPCKFYNLIETWDGWEPWDTLHQVPDKLRWAMWAFSHAAALTPDGLKVPDGSYISWMNNRAMELLSETDVDFIRTHLDAAQASAGQIERIFGATLVYNRAMMEWLNSEHPDWHVSEWIDDQAAMLMKWCAPILSATRAEWLARIDTPPDALLLQTPGRLDDSVRQMLDEFEGPVLATGRADVLGASIRQKAGIALDGAPVEAGFVVCSGDSASPSYDCPYIPAHQPVKAAADAVVCYGTARTPLVVRCENWLYWQPPDWSEPNNPFAPKYQLGSTYPHYRVATWLQTALHEMGLSYVEGIERPHPVALHLWRSGGKLYVLLGNLETGEFGDSRTPRHIKLHLSRAQLGLGDGWYNLERVDSPQPETVSPTLADTAWLSYPIDLPPEGCAVYTLVTG